MNGSDSGTFFAQFFEKAASNVKENVGEDVQTDQLIKEACRNCLEHVSKTHYLDKLCLKLKKREYSLSTGKSFHLGQTALS